MRKRKKKNWIVELYEDNKLYIWIVIGVLVISGVTIGITVGNNTNSMIVPNVDVTYDNKEDIGIAQTNTTPVKEDNIDNKDITDEKENKIIQSKTLKNEKEEKGEDEKNIEEAENEKIDNSEQNKSRKLEFVMPLDGQVSKDYSDNTLIYSNTLEEWISHTGIDIKAERATPVKSIEAGTVIGVKQDPRYGYTIIIDHGQGYKSIYCNLSTLDMVFEGKNVEKGQVISGVGDTALFEIKDDMHLHLEIMYNEEYINPLEILK